MDTGVGEETTAPNQDFAIDQVDIDGSTVPFLVHQGRRNTRDVIGVDDINRNCDSELDLQHPAVKSVSRRIL